MNELTTLINLGLGGVGLYFMYRLYDKSIDKHSETMRGLMASIDNNTRATEELYTYVKVRNGTLERLVKSNTGVKKAAKEALER